MSNITHPAVSEQLLVRIAAGDKAALAELYAHIRAEAANMNGHIPAAAAGA